MADAKDILGIASPKSGPTKLDDFKAPKRIERGSASFRKKSNGLSREVAALKLDRPEDSQTYSDVPLVPISILHQGLKKKRELNIRQESDENDVPAHWEWKPFRSSARADNSIFHHWTKSNDDDIEDYPWAKFNKKISIFQFSKEDYINYLNDDTGNWNEEETMKLWELCIKFDLRFHIIFDRFDSDGVGVKTIEDLKERYYDITLKLLKINEEKNNGNMNEIISKKNENQKKINFFEFNSKNEKKRKFQFEKIYSRTTEQLEEEKYLQIEYKRIEQNVKKSQKSTEKKNKKLKKNSEKKSKNIPKKKKLKLSSDYIDTQLNQPPPTVQLLRKEKPSGVSLRSTIIKSPLNVSVKTAQQLEEVLIELGMSLCPLSSLAVSHSFFELRNEIVQLLHLQKVCGMKEYQLKMLKEQRESLLAGKRRELRNRK